MTRYGSCLRFLVVLMLVSVPTTFVAAPKAHAWYNTAWLTVNSFYWDTGGYSLDAEYQVPGNTTCGKSECLATISLVGFGPARDGALPSQEVFAARTPLYTEPDTLRVTKSGGMQPLNGDMVSLQTTMDFGGCCTAIGTPVRNFVIAMLTDDEIRPVVRPSISGGLNPCDAFPLVGADRGMDVTDERLACNAAFQDAVTQAGSRDALLDNSRLLFSFLKSVRDETSNAFFRHWLTRLPMNVDGKAAPSEAPKVTVTRLDSGGYQISWTPVADADGYELRRTAAETTGGDRSGYIPSYNTPLMAEVARDTVEYVTPDLLSADANLGPYSATFYVAARNAAGVGPAGRGQAGCAEAYFVAARGSGQNPSAGTYADGLGSRGAAVYEDLRRRLGLSRSQFQANSVNYPAKGVDWASLDQQNYWSSHAPGVTGALMQLRSIEDKCASARVVLFGYSQGAHVIGDAFEASPSEVKRQVLSLQLFADAARRPHDLTEIRR